MHRLLFSASPGGDRPRTGCHYLLRAGQLSSCTARSIRDNLLDVVGWSVRAVHRCAVHGRAVRGRRVPSACTVSCHCSQQRPASHLLPRISVNNSHLSIDTDTDMIYDHLALLMDPPALRAIIPGALISARLKQLRDAQSHPPDAAAASLFLSVRCAPTAVTTSSSSSRSQLSHTQYRQSDSRYSWRCSRRVTCHLPRAPTAHVLPCVPPGPGLAQANPRPPRQWKVVPRLHTASQGALGALSPIALRRLMPDSRRSSLRLLA